MLVCICWMQLHRIYNNPNWKKRTQMCMSSSPMCSSHSNPQHQLIIHHCLIVYMNCYWQIDTTCLHIMNEHYTNKHWIKVMVATTKGWVHCNSSSWRRWGPHSSFLSSLYNFSTLSHAWNNHANTWGIHTNTSILIEQ